MTTTTHVKSDGQVMQKSRNAYLGTELRPKLFMQLNNNTQTNKNVLLIIRLQHTQVK